VWWWWTREDLSPQPDRGQQCLSSQNGSPGSKLRNAQSGMCLQGVVLSWRVATCWGHVEKREWR